MLRRFPVMRMRWRHLLFAHWPVDPAALRPLIPSSLEIDTCDGSAWVGLVPFTMEDVSPVFLPRIPGGWREITDFHECNVRTYVYPRGRRDDPAAHGVWFFSLDAANRVFAWGVRTFWRLPYFHAKMHLRREGDVIDCSVDRTAEVGVRPRLRCSWRALEPMPQSKPSELAHFLTERYCLYALRRHGTRGEAALHCGRIAHAPWELRRVELLNLDDSLMRAAGIGVDLSRQQPLLYHADQQDVRAWWLERVEG